MKRGCEHASRTKRRRFLTMPSYKLIRNPLCRKFIFAINLSLREIYLCEKSISAGNLSSEALDADKIEETN